MIDSDVDEDRKEVEEKRQESCSRYRIVTRDGVGGEVGCERRRRRSITKTDDMNGSSTHFFFVLSTLGLFFSCLAF